jgi:hypothetical protein
MFGINHIFNRKSKNDKLCDCKLSGSIADVHDEVVWAYPYIEATSVKAHLGGTANGEQGARSANGLRRPETTGVTKKSSSIVQGQKCTQLKNKKKREVKINFENWPIDETRLLILVLLDGGQLYTNGNAIVVESVSGVITYHICSGDELRWAPRGVETLTVWCAFLWEKTRPCT